MQADYAKHICECVYRYEHSVFLYSQDEGVICARYTYAHTSLLKRNIQWNRDTTFLLIQDEDALMLSRESVKEEHFRRIPSPGVFHE